MTWLGEGGRPGLCPPAYLPPAPRPSVLQAGSQQGGHSALCLCLTPCPRPSLSRWPACHPSTEPRSLEAQPELGAVWSVVSARTRALSPYFPRPLSSLLEPSIHPTDQPAPPMTIQGGTLRATPSDTTRPVPWVHTGHTMACLRPHSSSEDKPGWNSNLWLLISVHCLTAVVLRLQDQLVRGL